MDAEDSRASVPTVHVSSDQEDQSDLRRGPWTVEEDLALINYIHNHGEGRWNSLARLAGLKRTGKSCRLRWLNYLRPDVRRGNITLEEQLLILELHSRWGNRWSKIAQYLPGRTDNEIKNYWRTRVQKHAKQLKCDVNSKQFKDTMRYLWMPRLVERIQAAASSTSANTIDSGISGANSTATATTTTATTTYSNYHHPLNNNFVGSHITPSYTPENSSTAASSDSFTGQVSPISDFADQYTIPNLENPNLDYYFQAQEQVAYDDSSLTTSPSAYNFEYGSDFPAMDQKDNQCWLDGGDQTLDSLWNVDNIWFLQQQQHNNNNM